MSLPNEQDMGMEEVEEICPNCGSAYPIKEGEICADCQRLQNEDEIEFKRFNHL